MSFPLIAGKRLAPRTTGKRLELLLVSRFYGTGYNALELLEPVLLVLVELLLLLSYA